MRSSTKTFALIPLLYKQEVVDNLFSCREKDEQHKEEDNIEKRHTQSVLAPLQNRYHEDFRPWGEIGIEWANRWCATCAHALVYLCNKNKIAKM